MTRDRQKLLRGLAEMSSLTSTQANAVAIQPKEQRSCEALRSGKVMRLSQQRKHELRWTTRLAQVLSLWSVHMHTCKIWEQEDPRATINHGT